MLYKGANNILPITCTVSQKRSILISLIKWSFRTSECLFVCNKHYLIAAARVFYPPMSLIFNSVQKLFNIFFFEPHCSHSKVSYIFLQLFFINLFYIFLLFESIHVKIIGAIGWPWFILNCSYKKRKLFTCEIES